MAILCFAQMNSCRGKSNTCKYNENAHWNYVAAQTQHPVLHINCTPSHTHTHTHLAEDWPAPSHLTDHTKRSSKTHTLLSRSCSIYIKLMLTIYYIIIIIIQILLLRATRCCVCIIFYSHDALQWQSREFLCKLHIVWLLLHYVALLGGQTHTHTHTNADTWRWA